MNFSEFDPTQQSPPAIDATVARDLHRSSDLGERMQAG